VTSIAEERQRLSDVGLVLRIRPQWGARFTLYVNGKWVDGYTVPRAVDEPATILAAHIAVVDDPNDLQGTEDQVMRNIENIGINRFPNTGISYNAAAFDTGRLYEGQPIGRRGAHTVNDYERSTCSQSGCPSLGDSLTAPSWNNNVNARACVAPQMVGDECTDAQVNAFARWGAGLKLAGFVTRDARWHGHRCFAAKACPGGNVWGRLDDIQDQTADYVRDGLPGTGDDDVPLTPEDIEKVARAVWEAERANLVNDVQVETGKLLSATHRNTYELREQVALLRQAVADLQPEPPAPVA
jgi:hypothetical protein